jgi:hypothetical protein
MFSAFSDAIHNANESMRRAQSARELLAKQAAMLSALRIAEEEIQKILGRRILVDIATHPPTVLTEEWSAWIAKTGVNSLCNEATWDFTMVSSYNRKQVEQWEARGIKRIFLTVETNPAADVRDWAVCRVDWEPGRDDMLITWYPRALTFQSPNGWLDSGPKCWWVLRDEIVFGLKIYQLPGKCLFKSDWVVGSFDGQTAGSEGVANNTAPPPQAMPKSNAGAAGTVPNGKQRRWFQLRHWIILWFAEAQPGWNCAWMTNPPPLQDGSPFKLDAVLALPQMPTYTMPQLRLPTFPDIELVSTSVTYPTAPQPRKLSEFGMASSGPSKQKRLPSGRWDCHGYITLDGVKCVARGKRLILSNAKVVHLYDKTGAGTIEAVPEPALTRFEVECENEEQAKSWRDSLLACGIEEGEVQPPSEGCCTVS